MPWLTPTLEELRATNRSNVQAKLRSGPMVPNSVLRVISDTNAGLGYLTLLYIDWLAKQLMPDTAETAWLDRHASIWLTQGRKTATFASGVLNVTGVNGTVLPSGSLLNGGAFQTTQAITIGTGPTPVNVVALIAGRTGLIVGSGMSFSSTITNVDSGGVIATFTDGIAEESDDELRVRVLFRIRQPPMGGDANDYVAWATEVPGVTRAWAAPNEMGVGTITVRFMMDNLRLSAGGIPTAGDIATVRAHLDLKRPVAIKDFFVQAVIPDPINFTISNLVPDNTATRAAIAASVKALLYARAAPAFAINGVTQPAQTIYAAWISEAILAASGVERFTLTMADHPMPNNGNMASFGVITYV